MATLKRSIVGQKTLMKHVNSIQKEFNTESLMNDDQKTIYFKKYYRAILQHAYDSVIMTPYNTSERLSQNNNVPIPLSPEEVRNQIETKALDIFEDSVDLLMPIIEDKLLRITMLNGTVIQGYWDDIDMKYSKIVPNQDDSLPFRLTDLNVILRIKKIQTREDRMNDPTINHRFDFRGNETIYVRRTIPMHEIDTIQMIEEERKGRKGGKRRTRRSKRSKRSKRTRRHK